MAEAEEETRHSATATPPSSSPAPTAPVAPPPQQEPAGIPPATAAGLSMKPDYSEKSRFKTAPKTTVKITDLLKVDPKKEQANAEIKAEPDQPFTPEQLQNVWNEFAEQRKKFQAEYQLLNQAYDLQGSQITVHLYSTVHDLMLGNLKNDLTTFLREKLKNNSILVVGEFKAAEEKKVMYTPREKFDYLVSKNPMLKELKDRLGLDTDF